MKLDEVVKTAGISEKEALKILQSIRKKFKQAFIVSFKNGKRIK